MADKILVNVGRLGNIKPVKVSEEATIEKAFKEAKLKIASNEVIQDLDGNQFEKTDIVEEGRCYLANQKVKSGY